MRQILSRSVLTVAAASSILAVTGGHASADSDARGGAAGSPGVLSGNSVSAPVDVPVNACGNSVDAVGALNPAFGNTCANVSHSAPHHASGANAEHTAKGSPGLVSGNSVDIPVHVPVNACGNTGDAAALLNPSFGNTCHNGEAVPAAETPGTPAPPGPAHNPPQRHGTPLVPPARTTTPGLALTGFSGGELGAGGAAGAALLLGGAILYRRRPRPARARRGTHARH